MKISNFSNSELENYYNNKQIVFFKYKRCFILSKEKNKFKFTEFKEGKTKEGKLPHTRRGKFHAFEKESSYCKTIFNK